MSALTLTAAPVDRPRQTRWLLRLHRPAIYTWAVLWLALVTLLLALDGPLLNAAADAWRQYESCTTSGRCSYDQNAILRYKDYYNYATTALNVLPFVLAAWAGAALTGRELESGTARLAWTQATSPAHWLAVRLAVPALGVTVCTGLLAWLHHRAWTASQGRIENTKEWYDRFTFHAGGPTLAAMALAGLAAGALAGLLLRRTLPALAVGLVAVGVVRWLTELAMPHLWPAVTRLSTVDQGFLGKGMVVDQGMVTASGAHVPPPTCDYTVPSCATVFDRFTGRYNTYQPQSHLWGAQLTTTALTLAVAALLVTGCFLVLRRQTGTLRAARP
ncbi:ABC transporter permease [Streptomyces sp. SID685]|uniref:ABC transporter permease n=1 Tax=Streptomyces sp. SID685 TaxID=2690322 RepID=UPI0013691E35|nr:ABC transporter permease [Streptomyces sp. SID685]